MSRSDAYCCAPNMSGSPGLPLGRSLKIVNLIALPGSKLAPVLEPDGALPEAIGASAFAARLKDELAQWKRIAAKHKITAE